MRGARRRTGLAALALLALAGAAQAGAAAPPPAFAGRWLVIRDLGAPGISAMSERQAQAMLGLTIRLTKGRAQFGRDTCTAASYALRHQKVAAFLGDFRLTRRALPLPGRSVRTLDVTCRGKPFHSLSLLDNRCALYVWDGRFFAAQREGAQAACRW